MVFLMAVVLGAAAIQVKFLRILWRGFFDIWMGTQPRWLVWMTLEIATVAAIFGLTLGFVYDWPR